MRSLQFQLHRHWDRVEDSTLVSWTPACRLDLLWWLDEPRLQQGVPLVQVSLDLDFWSDGSDVGWGSHLGPEVVSGLWSPDEVGVSINARELLAVEKGLLHFQSSLRGSTVDNSTAVAYLYKSGGARSLFLNEIAQRILRWSELHAITLAPQFIPGSRNVLADSLSRPHQSLGSEWTLHRDVFRDLRLQWPVMVDLFATSANHRCSVYFSPFRDPQAAGTDAFLQSWDELQAYAFPLWSVIPRVLAKLCASRGTFLTLVAPYWPQRPWFPEFLDLAVAPPVVLPSRPDLLFQPLSGLHHPDLLRLRLHAWRLSGDSLVRQVGLARRASSRTNYQLNWSTFRSWCHKKGHLISRPSVSKVADFLLWLHCCRGLSVSSIMGYRSMLSAVFRFQLPELSSHLVLRDLLRSFRLAAHCRPLRPPVWDLAAVLTYLNSTVFEPLRVASLRNLTKKVLFLFALATAKRVGELQALSRLVSFVHADACVSYVPEFVAKTESLSNPIPRSFLAKSLSDFVAGLQEKLLLCPVRALRIYLDRSASFSPLPRRLFISPRWPSRALSKNAISFFLCEAIHEVVAGRPAVGPVRAHSIRGVSTSAAFHRNWSVASVLESATWRSNSVFVSFYLCDIQHEIDGIRSLGPFVAAGSRIG